MKHWNVCLSTVGMPLLLQSFEKLMTGWLMAARSTLWASRRGFKCREWGWLNEKSVQCSLSSNTWECLWQAFQEEDQYNSYHVSHIDHWLSIVIRVPHGKPMLLVLKRGREGNRGMERKHINAGFIIWNRLILSHLNVKRNQRLHTLFAPNITFIVSKTFQPSGFWIKTA